MLKFTNNFSNTKLVLVRRYLADGSCSAVILMRSQPALKKQVRHQHIPPKHHTASPPDCPPSHPYTSGSRFFRYTVIGATLLTGATVIYAKRSPDTRNWLESNVPWMNNLIALVYQENTTYWKFTVDQFNNITTRLSHFVFGKEGVTPMEFKQRSEQDIDADAAIAYAKKEYELPPAKFGPLYVEEVEVKPEPANVPALVVHSEKCEPQKPKPMNITKTMVELEHDMQENTKAAIDNYKKALKFCTAYNKAIYKVVESSAGDMDNNVFAAVEGAANERETYLKKAKEASSKAKCAIGTLERMIKQGVDAPPDRVAQTVRDLKQFMLDIEKAEDDYKAELEKSVLSDKYWNKVEAARKMYKDELQALFPGIDLNARKLNVKGDTDLLLLYTLRQVQFLQAELAEAQTVRELKINRAIECHDEKAIIEAKVEELLKAERVKREFEYQKQALALQAQANKNLKEQVLKQVEIQQAVQAAALAKKEKEILAKFNRSVSEALEKERVQFKKDLAVMAGKLMAIEATLKKRAQAEAEARRSQSLWAAAEALLAATRRSDKEVNIANEIKALEKAGAGDKMVETVLKGIPNEAREKVVTEKALRDTFEMMEKTAAKVALVGREGAALPVYFLSWLQSKLLFSKLAEIPQDELENYPTDFTKLDTFDIIQRARYHMENGDLSSALRYVNLLQGGARAAAVPWLDAAKRHLEIKQAAEAVMAHASVSGLLYT